MSQPELGSQQPGERSRSWIIMVCLVLLSATFLNYSNRFAFTQNATQVMETFDLSEEEYRKLAGKFGMGFAIGGLTFGILADVVSVRWLYPLVVLMWSIAGFSSGMVGSLFGLGVSRFVLGLFEAGHWPCALRTTQRTFKPADRTWGNSVLQSGASLGAIATPLMVLVLLGNDLSQWQWIFYDAAQWRWVFYIIGGLGVPWVVWWLLTVSEADVRRPVIQTDETATGEGQEQELQEIPFLHIFLTRRWWLLLIVVICINTLWHYIRVWMPVMLEKDHGYSREFIQYFTALYYLATFFGSLVSGWMAVTLARKNWNVHKARLMVFFVFGILSTLAIPAAFMPRGNMLLGTLLVVAFGSLGLFPIYYSLNQEISAKHQGKVGGSLGFSTWMILSFLHPKIGAMVDVDPEIRPYLFAGVGIGPMIGFLVLLFFWGKRPTVETIEN